MLVPFYIKNHPSYADLIAISDARTPSAPKTAVMSQPVPSLLNPQRLAICNHYGLLAASAEVTTGGNVYLGCGIVISPKGGSVGGR